jgi:hypothetical protein
MPFESFQSDAQSHADAAPSHADLMTNNRIVAGAERVRLRGRILMMTTVVPPAPTGVAFVVNGLLSQFDRDEVVVAAQRWQWNSPDQTHEPNGHPVHFIDRQWTWPKRGQRYVHWLKWLLVPRMAYRLIKLARSQRCEAIFAHFPDEQCLCAAYLAARRTGLGFYPFFHNTYRENRRGLAYLFASWLQLRAFRKAKVVFVMSRGMQEEWRRIYPEQRFEPLVHTFQGEVPLSGQLPAVNCGRVRLGYLGSIGEANLDALRRVCQVVNESPNLELNIYSGAPGWFLEKEGLIGPRIRHEQPPDEVLQAKLRENELLFLPHGLTGGLAPIEYRTIFPTRTIPYLLAGRPILAHSARDSFLTKWLREHGCAELVEDPDPGALRAAIDRLCRDEARRQQLVQNALSAADQFRAKRVVNDMKSIINRCWNAESRA